MKFGHIEVQEWMSIPETSNNILLKRGSRCTAIHMCRWLCSFVQFLISLKSVLFVMTVKIVSGSVNYIIHAMKAVAKSPVISEIHKYVPARI